MPLQGIACMSLLTVEERLRSTKGSFINYVRVLRERGGGLDKSLHTFTFGEGGQTHSYVIFSKSIFYIRNRAVLWFGGIIFHLCLEGKKRIGMSCFSVNDPFLSIFY